MIKSKNEASYDDIMKHHLIKVRRILWSIIKDSIMYLVKNILIKTLEQTINQDLS